ncbi:MAG TPA: thiamine pyrophosphate-binding protein [Phycisphaerae bacterium]|nr:thiamine pyrophosphate-binding protein [Phycisphaerae bacterium]
MITLSEYLIRSLHKHGVRHVFGLPGDFVIGLYDLFERDGRLKPIVMAHEPGAGFAADAYARCKGLGVALITYCVGGLNCVNAVAEAYAEKSPVLIVSGGPGIGERKPNALLHHRVKTFETQRNVFEEVTCKATVLDSPVTAPRQIAETLATIKRLNRPGYIEIPRDLYLAPVSAQPIDLPQVPLDAEALDELVAESIEMCNNADRPVLMVGIEVHRLRLAEKVRQLAAKLGARVVTTLEAKGVLPEDEILGVYAGALSSGPHVRQTAEDSDCVLMLGAFMTEFNLGVYTAHLDPRRTISVSNEEARIGHHVFPGVALEPYVDALLGSRLLLTHSMGTATEHVDHRPAPARADALSVNALYRLLDERIDRDHLIVCDVGDCLFAAIGLHIPQETGLLAPANYTSMGFGVPGAIGAELALPEKRPIVLVGDGAFRMTGNELATAVRYKLSPIVIILNNSSFVTLQNVASGPFNDLIAADYRLMLDMYLPGRSFRCHTVGEFLDAFEAAASRRAPALIDVVIDPQDCSDVLNTFSVELARRAQSSSQTAASEMTD